MLFKFGGVLRAFVAERLGWMPERPDKDENKNPCKERSTGEDNRRRRRRWHPWSSSSLLSSEIEILKRVCFRFFLLGGKLRVSRVKVSVGRMVS